MSDWPTIERELSRRPPVTDGDIERVMARVHAERGAEQIATSRAPAERARLAWVMRPVTITMRPLYLLAATLLVAVGVHAALGRTRSGPPHSTRVAAGNVQLQPVQFFFVAPEARAVAIAGDFNDWSRVATPLRREGASGVWSVVVPLAPGRHLYSFVVDGERWVPDSTAPRAPENEFGAVNSVVLVDTRS